MHSPIMTELPPPPPGKTGWPWTEESPQSARTQVFGKNLASENPWPRVSIVTPSYNQGQLPEKAILSQSIFVCRDPLNDSVEVACV